MSLVFNKVDVAPNEYITKYSYNRNFLKLVINDNELCKQVFNSKIDTYHQKRVYNAGDLVFYKTSPDSIYFYLLKSAVDGNTEPPLIHTTENNQKLVANSDNWKIVGIPEDNGNLTPQGKAVDYIDSATNNLHTDHELNDKYHPSGELNQDKSKFLFKTLTNISTEQKKIMYPSHLQSLVADNVIQSGYVRQWDNGLLEYDIVYRLGYNGKTEDGLDLIIANNYSALNRNKNYLYFKENKDFNIFNKNETGVVTNSDTKQVNLNSHVNVYSSEIKLPIQFKDTNYMIFQTGIKNTDTESVNVTRYDLTEYDSRLSITGLEVVGYLDSASYKNTLIIPKEVLSLKKYSLADLEGPDGFPVSVLFEEESQLQVLDEYCFSNSQIESIELPKSLRYIATGVFENCNLLTSITINVNSDLDKQVKLQKNALRSITNLKEINLIYDDPITMFSVSEEAETQLSSLNITTDIYDKLNNLVIQDFYGIYDHSIKINKIFKSELTKFSRGATFSSSEIPLLFSAGVETKLKYDETNTLTGYESDFLEPVGLSVKAECSKIAEKALAGFSNLTSLVIQNRVNSISAYALSGCNNLKSVTFTYDEADYSTLVSSNFIGSFKGSSVKVINFSNLSTTVSAINEKLFRNSSYDGTIEGEVISSNLWCIPNNCIVSNTYSPTELSDMTQAHGYMVDSSYTDEEGYHTVYSMNYIPYYLSYDTNTLLSCQFKKFKEYIEASYEKAVTPSADAEELCASFQNIGIPGCFTTIETSAFNAPVEYQRLVKNIFFPTSITEIKDYAFSNNQSISAMALPRSLSTYLGNNIFSGCSSLESLTI